MMHMFNDSRGAVSCRIDNDGPERATASLLLPQHCRLTPRPVRIAPAALNVQRRICIGGHRDGD